MHFLQHKNIDNIPTSKTELDKILQEFWPSLRKGNGDEYNASSLITNRQLLRLYLKEEKEIDIISDTEFLTSNKIFENYIKTLKSKGKGSIKHYPVIPVEDLEKITKSLNKNDPAELQLLVWFYIQYYFCRRGRENTALMTKSELIFSKINNKEIISLRNEETKNHKEINESQDSGGIIVSLDSDKCPVKIIKLYLSLLNDGFENLWQKPMTVGHSKWYACQKVGANKIGEFMKIISKKCSLSTIYTNHSLRATVCTHLGNWYGDIEVRSISKHKSLNSLPVYKRPTIEKKLEMASSLSTMTGIKDLSATGTFKDKDYFSNIDLDEWDDFLNKEDTSSDPNPGPSQPIFNLSNCTNITINYNK